MKKNSKQIYKKPEFVVFGIIIVVIIVGTAVTLNSQPSKSLSLPVVGKAPELAAGRWINSQPLSTSRLKGKVVLVDFWTYSCINCIRTIPFLNSLHAKYSPQLVIIGVHSPEFEFEKDYSNVKAAVDKYNIKYPVVQDNDHETWKAFGNNFWPRQYLIDKEGNIRYDHIGEGGDEEIEKAVQQLLGTTGGIINMTPDVDFSQIGTPEIYLGYNFARSQIGNPEGTWPESTVDYKQPNITQGNIIYLSGTWKNEADKIISVNNSKLFLVYRAKSVNIVAGGNATINIFVEGFRAMGNDITNGAVNVNSQQLYNVVSMESYGTYMLEIDAQPGLELYTLTFG